MKKTGKDRKRYERVAKFYDIFEFPMEVFAFSEWRKSLIKNVEGSNILEVGIGTGKNIPYYRNWYAVGLDISEKMLKKAVKRSKSVRKKIDFVLGDAEFLPFRDHSFDGIISTCVFCSVENPENGLKELFRVLKPGGRAYFLEHVRSENDTVGKIMDALNPVIRAVGPEINRRTVDTIRKTGFRILKDVHLMSSIFRMVVAEKPATSAS